MKEKLNADLYTKVEILICYIYLVFSFAFLDVWLRVVTRWINTYSIYSLAPNLFTLLWAVLLTALLSMIPSPKVSRIAYGVLYFLFMIYAVVQYGAYLVIGRFLYISDFLYAGEGTDYMSWVISLLSPGFLLQVILLSIIGVTGLLFYPRNTFNAGKRSASLWPRISIAAICIVAMLPIPYLYGDASVGEQWALNPAIEYQRFVNANYDLELTGMYQYIVRDMQIQAERLKNRGGDTDEITEFLSRKAAHTDNDYTGIFSGKNIIVVMMESMDDWMISESDTPTIWHMMANSINFTNLYTPEYSSGYTFNSEFAFVTSIYPYSNGNAAYALSRNNFTDSIAHRFSDAGYSVESFHEGIPTFYNRANMHSAFGFSKYHYYGDYPHTEFSIEDDRYLIACDALYEEFTNKEPFFSFLITVSPHLPYSGEDEAAKTALSIYPQYDVAENREINVLRAKARLTDDMFAGLLQRLKADGLLENTVIVGFADHYAYGITDKEQLQCLSEDAGSSILEKTPAFIYCAGCNLSVKIDKVMQITDLAPTIMNLFGLDVPTEIMGQDVFDENYAGYAIFPNGTWLTNSTYVKNGIVQWNNGMTEEEITEMNAYVQQVYTVNDAILDSDYYASNAE